MQALVRLDQQKTKVLWLWVLPGGPQGRRASWEQWAGGRMDSRDVRGNGRVTGLWEWRSAGEREGGGGGGGGGGRALRVAKRASD